MKFTWRIELKNGKIFECELTRQELIELQAGIIDFSRALQKIDKKMEEEDAI